MEAYEGAVQVDESHLASALALARLHLEQGAPEKGRAVCARLLQAHPNNLDAKLLVVQLLLAQVQLDCHVDLQQGTSIPVCIASAS